MFFNKEKKEKLKIIFIGSDFRRAKNLSVLRYLKENNHNVVAVIGKHASDQKYKDIKVNRAECVQDLKKLKPDLAVCVYFGQIFKKEFLDIFPLGCINFHPSYLPNYSGNAPVMAAIANGEKKHGATIHFMDEGIDTGDILAQSEVSIDENDTSFDLSLKCEIELFKLLPEALQGIQNGTAQRVPQKGPRMMNTKHADFCDKEVSQSWDSERQYNFIRACTLPPHLPAHIYIDGKKVYVTSKQYLKKNDT